MRKQSSLIHNHLIMKGQCFSPPMKTATARTWMIGVVESQNMSLLAEPIAKYSQAPGNRGITVMALITTSHVVAHFWDEVIPTEFQLDLYSCAPIRVGELVNSLSVFQPTNIKYKIIDRSDNANYCSNPD